MILVFDKSFPNYDERFLCKRVRNEGGRYQDKETWYEVESTATTSIHTMCVSLIVDEL